MHTARDGQLTIPRGGHGESKLLGMVFGDQTPAPSSSGLQTVPLTPSLPASQNDLRGPALSTHLNPLAFSLAVLLSVAFSPESEDFPLMLQVPII